MVDKSISNICSFKLKDKVITTTHLIHSSFMAFNLKS